jgi:hypothetical protein
MRQSGCPYDKEHGIKQAQRAVFAVGLLVLFAGILIKTHNIVTAVGNVTELPFIGSYNVSCGYHSVCSATPTPGYGLDFVNRNESTYGDVAYASGRGTVTASGWEDGGWGFRVIIRHPDNHYSRYAHLAYYFPAVNHKILQGAPIGYMGSTGNSTGPHLHFQVYSNTTSGGGVNPTPIDGYTEFCDAGKTCGPYNNYSFNTELRLVDNTDSGFTLIGSASCQNNTTNGFHRDGLDKTVIYYRYCNGVTSSPTITGTWTPSLPAPAYYHIYVFAPNHNGITLSQGARYQIYSNNTLIATVSINQNGYNNDWVRLGTWYLGTSGTYVRLTNQTSDGQRIAYDAIMFVRDF